MMSNVPMTPKAFLLAAVTLFGTYLALATLLSPGSKAGRKYRNSPHYSRTIVAVGDLHGDYPNMQKVLTMSGVLNSTGHWSGNVDFLVQTGDIVDRGDDTIKIYRFMEKLRGQARRQGGDVISHFGNHEIMNLIGDWRYVPSSEIKTFGSVEARQKAFAKGWIGKSFRANYSITTRLPLHPSVGDINEDYVPGQDEKYQGLSHAALSFLHGGLAPTYKNLTPYPSAINEIGATLVRRLQDRPVQPPPHPPNPYPGLPKDSTQEEIDLYGSDGPLWYRGWAMDKEAIACKKIDAVLQKTGVRRIVMGHTPNFAGMISRCGGKIILIDTGISGAYGGVLSAARFTYTIKPTSRAGVWTEEELVEAIYPSRTDVLTRSERELTGEF